MKLKNKQKITDWLDQGDFESVLKELKTQLRQAKSLDEENLETLTSLSAQHEKVLRDKMKGIISYEQQNLQFNKLLSDLQDFVKLLENQDVKPPVVNPPPKPAAQTQGTEDNKNGWWFLLVILAGVGIWYFFLREKPIEATILICTINQMSNEHWCDNDLPRMTQNEANNSVYVSAAFTGGFQPDDLVIGTLYSSDGSVFATKKIQLTSMEGDLGSSAMILPAQNAVWFPDTYTLKISVNGEYVGEKKFEVF